MTQPTRTTCKPDAHDFVPKRQVTSPRDGALDITEVFCRKCGTVCFLTTQEPAEPSRVKLVTAAN